MDNKTTIRLLRKIRACEEAIQWVTKHGGNSESLWRDCERGDWMGWYLGKSTKYNKLPSFYLALADIIDKQAVPIYAKYNPEEKALKNVVKTLRLYSQGKATREDLLNAAYAAYAAHAASNVAHAAQAAQAAYAAHAAAHATYASACADRTNTREKSLKQSAKIFRKHFPNID